MRLSGVSAKPALMLLTTLAVLAPLPLAAAQPVVFCSTLQELLLDDDDDGKPNLLGRRVRVSGVITGEPLDVGGGKVLGNLEDGTGGVALYGVASVFGASLPKPGKLIEVEGELGSYLGMEEIQISSVKVLGEVNPLDPIPALAADVRAGRHEGRIVRLSGHLLPIEDPATATVRFSDSSGAVTVYLVRGLLQNPAFVSKLAAGGKLSLVGIVRERTSADAQKPLFLISPRDPADFQFERTPPVLEFALVGTGVLLLILYLMRRRTLALREAARWRELTTRLQASQAGLRASEERYRKLVESAEDMIFLYGPDASILDVNAAAESVTGYRREELLGKRIHDIVANACDVEPLLSPVGAGAPGPSPCEVELEAIRADRTSIILSVRRRPEIDATGGLYYHAIARDVTQRRWIENRLKESEARFRLIAENIDRVLWILDPWARRFLYLNRAVHRIWGRGEEYFLAGGVDVFFQTVHPDDRVKVTLLFEKLKHENAEAEFRVLRPDGEVRVVQFHAFAIHGAKGEIGRVIGFASDVTETRRMEELAIGRARLESIGRFAGGIAHDFKNVLCVVNGFAELLRTRSGLDREGREFLGQILRAGESGNRLASSLLAFSRPRPIEPRAIDMNCVIREMGTMLTGLLGSGIKLHFSLHPSRLVILIDLAQFEQILMNLAVNARDAMPEGGDISISSGMTFPPDRSGPDSPSASAVITFRDTGCGIPDSLRARIFEPYFTTKAQGHGTGLGLATVHAIVKQNGGDIRVESGVGSGTRFDLTFPLVERDADAGGQTIIPDKRISILVADDDPAVRTFVRTTLEREGHQITEAPDGPDAFRLFDGLTSDLKILITDVAMPGMTGDELARRLFLRFPDLKVLFISGQFDRNPLGADRSFRSAFLRKPFRRQALLDMIRDLAFGAPAELSR